MKNKTTEHENQTTPATTENDNGKTSAPRRNPAQLFMDAVKERKDEIAELKGKLDKAEKDYASFVEQAKTAMGVE